MERGGTRATVRGEGGRGEGERQHKWKTHKSGGRATVTNRDSCTQTEGINTTLCSSHFQTKWTCWDPNASLPFGFSAGLFVALISFTWGSFVCNYFVDLENRFSVGWISHIWSVHERRCNEKLQFDSSSSFWQKILVIYIKAFSFFSFSFISWRHLSSS